MSLGGTHGFDNLLLRECFTVIFQSIFGDVINYENFSEFIYFINDKLNVVYDSLHARNNYLIKGS